MYEQKQDPETEATENNLGFFSAAHQDVFSKLFQLLLIFYLVPRFW